MTKANNKTQENDKNVFAFLESVENEKRKSDSLELLEIIKNISGIEPKMWGDSIIGYGNKMLKYASGRDVDYFKVGFSPRKQNLVLYLMQKEIDPNLLEKLGKHKKSKACVYINKLEDIDKSILKKLIAQSMK